MEGTSPGKHHMLSMNISSPNPDKEARALLCAPEMEDNGFGFILGKRGSLSQMEELWHGHRQRQHTQLGPKLPNECS